MIIKVIDICITSNLLYPKIKFELSYGFDLIQSVLILYIYFSRF